MSVSEVRKRLHRYIDGADQRLINMVYALMKEYDNSSAELSDEEKKAINRGISSIDKGRVLPHRKLIASMKKKYPNLKFK